MNRPQILQYIIRYSNTFLDIWYKCMQENDIGDNNYMKAIMITCVHTTHIIIIAFIFFFFNLLVDGQVFCKPHFHLENSIKNGI